MFFDLLSCLGKMDFGLSGLSVIEDLLKCIIQCFLFSGLFKVAAEKLELEKLQSLQTKMENVMTKYKI